MEEYCKQHKTLSYCKKVNNIVPPAFCFGCQGNWQKWRRHDIAEYRKENLRPLTEEQKNDKDLVSVVMPARECEKPYIERTLNSLHQTAVGPIETILICDGWGKCPKPKAEKPKFFGDKTIFFDEVAGQRKAVNTGVMMSRGKYIFRLDPHCAMSEGWDARMKSSCGETDLVAPVFDHLDEGAWQPLGRDTAFWIMDRNLMCRSVRPWKPIQLRMVEEDLMAISGGAWMIRKKYYNELGGHDESLGMHGNVGTEWSLKVWLTGGRCLIRTDVVCAHLFRKKTPFDYSIEERERARKQLYKRWVLGEGPNRKRPMEWLLYKFRACVMNRPIATVAIK